MDSKVIAVVCILAICGLSQAKPRPQAKEQWGIHLHWKDQAKKQGNAREQLRLSDVADTVDKVGNVVDKVGNTVDTVGDAYEALKTLFGYQALAKQQGNDKAMEQFIGPMLSALSALGAFGEQAKKQGNAKEQLNLNDFADAVNKVGDVVDTVGNTIDTAGDAYNTLKGLFGYQALAKQQGNGEAKEQFHIGFHPLAKKQGNAREQFDLNDVANTVDQVGDVVDKVGTTIDTAGDVYEALKSLIGYQALVKQQGNGEVATMEDYCALCGLTGSYARYCGPICQAVSGR